MIENLALVAPLGTVTEAGTARDGLAEERLTVTPETPAGLGRVTVPVTPLPPITLFEDKEIANGAPFTVRVLETVRPFKRAEMVATELDAEKVVVIGKRLEKLLLVETPTLAGTVTDGWFDDKATVWAVAGLPLRNTRAFRLSPANTVAGTNTRL